MSLFSLFRTADINPLAREAQENEGILLLDVRTGEEYRQGHIPGSVLLPLDRIGEIGGLEPDKTRPLYVYCHSGARSAQACRTLERMGYSRVKNIGGIASWRGPVETDS